MLLASHTTLKEGSSSSSAVYIDLTTGYLIDLYRGWGKPEQAAKYAAIQRELRNAFHESR